MSKLFANESPKTIMFDEVDTSKPCFMKIIVCNGKIKMD